MNRLMIVSNRLPVSASRQEGMISFEKSAGGLATGLSSLPRDTCERIWVGWPGIADDELTEADRTLLTEKLTAESYHPVPLTSCDIESYYAGFSNRTIWPLFHYFLQHVVYDNDLWDAYVRVNRKFCDIIVDIAREGDIFWVHDYQLMLLPQMLRERLGDVTIGFFLHIPFPSFEVFRLLPWRSKILEGLLGSDLIGFHTYDYARHFLSSIRNRLGLEHSFGQIQWQKRHVKVDTFPMGIDYAKYANAGRRKSVKDAIEHNRREMGGSKIILSVDRLDYTKGILHRLRSFDLFLEKYPEYHGKVTLVLVAVPSRTSVGHYQELKRELDEMVGRINGKYATMGWMPVWYMYTFLNFDELSALYKMADVCLVTPVRDGMNLIAKEFIAAKTNGKGVLILSEMAGAAKELSEAFIVNPNNMDRIADTIHAALTMPVKEQINRNRSMQKRIRRYDVKMWANDFMKSLIKIKEFESALLTKKLTQAKQDSIVSAYRNAEERLILLDYDGTLRSFEMNPQDAVPDRELLRVLIMLAADSRNEVCIISGRDRHTLGTWFKHFRIGLIAEHGVWIKEKDGDWELMDPIANYWKDEIRPIIEQYVDRTPGSLIEEKDYSLVWHYRKADSEQALIRARELTDALVHFTSNLGLGVLEGNKVVEIKNAGINKGNAALKWINREKYKFILAAGDDRTDEDIFAALPESAWSIKIGVPPSKARFHLDTPADMRSLLATFVSEGAMDDTA
jgi:trehalose 6-phosphate synthase/phosphatase